MHVKLKVLRGASTGKEVEIRGPRFFIGRSPECNLRANSDAISRRHCAITVGESDVTIKDLGSRNGTYVNGTRIDGEHRIKMGDQLRVGPLEFLVTHAAAARQTEKAPSAPDPGSAVSNDDEMAGLVSDWLEEGNEVDRQTRSIDPETREYKMAETDTDALKVDVGKDNGAAGDTKQVKSTGKKDKSTGRKEKSAGKTGDTGKLPLKASKKDAPKDTQEAAAQMLRKFFNRG